MKRINYLAAAALLLSLGCTKDDKTVAVTSVTLAPTTLTLEVGTTGELTATVAPDNATDKNVTWASDITAVATVSGGTVTAVAPGEATITAKAGEQSATCKVTVIPVGAVDLGLSVYWATCNLGANSPGEYGDYYAWGETETKENYNVETYKWYSSIFTKYNTADNKTVLDPEDDVAHVNLGGSWRVPTIGEVDELMSTQNNSSYQWEWKSLNGHNGWLVTYLVNNNSIFFPAAGYRYDTRLTNVGSRGDCWSSSLSTDFPDRAWYVYFDGGGVDRGYNRYRCYGFPVRPVSE